jgi:hypothetical protein
MKAKMEIAGVLTPTAGSPAPTLTERARAREQAQSRLVFAAASPAYRLYIGSSHLGDRFLPVRRWGSVN